MKQFLLYPLLVTPIILLAGFEKKNSENKIHDFPGNASIANVRIVEGNAGQKTVEVAVLISEPQTDPITIPYSTRNGTALAGSDYETAKGSLDFAKGETMKKIKVAIKGDVECEEDETFEIVLSSSSGVTFSDSIGTVTIINDDCLRNRRSAGGSSNGGNNKGTSNSNTAGGNNAGNNNTNSAGGNNSNPIALNNTQNVSVYEVRFTYTGYTTFYPDIAPCQIRTNGNVVLSGLLIGDENSDPDDPVLYVGVLNLEIDMDLCSVSTVEAPGGGYPNCGMTVRGIGPVKTELELDSTGTGYGWIKINYDKSLGKFQSLVVGGCDRQQMSEERSMVPNETKAAIFNGTELPLPMHILRVGRYVQHGDGGTETVIEILRKIQ